MRKHIAKGALGGSVIAATLAAVLVVPVAESTAAGLTRVGDERLAKHERHKHSKHKKHDAYHDHDHAWHVVRRDPCLLHEYQAFAERHENPRKRARFVRRLAREGCPDAYFYDHGHPRPARPFWYFFFGG